MIQKYFFRMLALLVVTVFAQGISAQEIDQNTGQVVWKGTKLADAVRKCQAGEFVYLCQFKETLSQNNPEKFLTSGGAYGVQGVVASIGMRVQILPARTTDSSAPDNSYQIVTRIENNNWKDNEGSDRLGFDEWATYDRRGNVTGILDGKNIYLDRKNKHVYTNDDKHFVNWTINQTTATKKNIKYKGQAEADVKVNVVTFQCAEPESVSGGSWWSYYSASDLYVGINDDRLITKRSSAVKWIIVSEDDYNEAMSQVTWGEVDLGVFVQDAHFGRDNKDVRYWVWENGDDTDNDGYKDDGWSTNFTHWHQRNQNLMNNTELVGENRTMTKTKIGANVWDAVRQSGTTISGDYSMDTYRDKFGQYYKGEIYNEKNKLTQKLESSNIPNLKEGLYKLTAQALYWDGYDGTTNGNSNQANAYFIVEREVVGGETTIERIPIKAMNDPEINPNNRTYNITPKSGVSAGYVMNTNARAYELTYYLELSGHVNLTIGIEQTVAQGWTVIGNVHLYAQGKQAVFINEDWSEEETITYKVGENVEEYTGDPYVTVKYHDHYEYPLTLYYNRTMTPDKWNVICLPVPMTGAQIIQTFGNGTKVSEFVGVNPNQKTMLCFKQPITTENAEYSNKNVIEALKPYIIKPTKEPDDLGETGIELEVGNGEQNHTVNVKGKVYYIAGVSGTDITSNRNADQTLKDPIPVTANGITFQGVFYRKSIGASTPDQDNWMITKGNLYHLTNTVDRTVWATYAYLYAPKNSTQGAKDFSIVVEEAEDGIDEIVTCIEGLTVVDEDGPVNDSNAIYNLSGQKMQGATLDTLPKGIYIVGGRKYVVR